MKSKICDILGIKYPVFQGAMAWIADASLASAVSNAGGLGIIAAGNAPADFVRGEIRKAKELTDKPFGVNVMLQSPFADEVVDAICEEKVKVVTTGAGNPGKYLAKLAENGVTVIPVVASVALAKRMEKMGVNAVIAEGMESGGHIGKLTTMALVPQVVDAVNIPVLAAGGIADSRGVNAAFMLGADGVQVGTRFLSAYECTVHQNYKAKILKAKDIDTVITGAITGHPVRVLKNKLTNAYLAIEKEETGKANPDLEKLETLGAGALRKAVVEGDVDNGSVMSGQIAGLVKKEESCSDIILDLVKDLDKIYEIIK
ncbi:MAG: enoyl-[acyl-carrier-protein] reductase FabK [Clostridiales bacterium]|nr:enoyl-[acyl-carrier-protein] reductase FabK [Clostridiales bacterium]